MPRSDSDSIFYSYDSLEKFLVQNIFLKTGFTTGEGFNEELAEIQTWGDSSLKDTT